MNRDLSTTRRGGRMDWTNEPLRAFYQRVFLAKCGTNKGQNTRRLYENSLRNFNRFLEREALLADLNDDAVNSFQGWHISRQNSPETANKDVGQLLAIWRFAARKVNPASGQHYVSDYPDVPLLSVPQRIPKAWLVAELASLFDSAAVETGEIAGLRACLWWTALLLTIWYTGERIGALLGVKWTDVDCKGGWIVFRAEVRKGKRRDKAYPLPPENCRALDAIRSNRMGKDLVFPWPRTLVCLYHYYDRILIRAGLPIDRKSKFHCIRKSTASYLKAAGGDPTEQLDHSDPKTTKRYFDPRIVGIQNTPHLLPQIRKAE